MFRKLINTFAGTKILSHHLATIMKGLYNVSLFGNIIYDGTLFQFLEICKIDQ